MPSPYTVTLVSPDMFYKSAVSKIQSEKVIQNTPETAIQAITETKANKERVREDQIKEDKISALAAKKSIERRVQLRNMISLKAGSPNQGEQTTQVASNAKGDLFDDYYRKITQEIWQQWVYPDTSRRDIEAIVSIRILKDGTALVQKIEKSSGNALFDRSALKALAKASPLAPPPYEMEVGVRFYP